VRISDNQIYALKQVKITIMKKKDQENALNEVRILASINHPNIISYKEAFFDKASSTLCIIMELADNGDLFKMIIDLSKS